MRLWFTLTRGKLLVVAGAVMALGLATPDSALACRALIGDFVWLDLNRNGVQDPGEPGIANVRVDLVTADGTTVLRSVSTDGSGYYSFASTIEKTEPPVCEETYLVRAAMPDSLSLTLMGAGGDPALDSNDPTGTVVTPRDIGQPWGTATDLTIDFGFVEPIVCGASIGNFVWNDLNNNGVQDLGEPGIAGNPVFLSGAATSQTPTNGSGIYSFGNLCAGTYTVCTGLPQGFQLSPTDAGADDARDSDGLANMNNSCATVTLGNSGSDNTIDFGFWQMPVKGAGTGTPGYWKNHPEAWPVQQITIGGVVYTKAQALYVLGLPDGDKTVTMFRHLVAAKLNVANGTNASCIASTISAADAWMTQYPLGSKVKSNSVAWRNGEPLKNELDAYNNGDRCAPHRD